LILACTSSLLLLVAHQRLDRKISSVSATLETRYSKEEENYQRQCKAASDNALAEAEQAIESAQEQLSDYQNSLALSRRILDRPTSGNRP
jgi:hypothetical protein